VSLQLPTPPTACKRIVAFEEDSSGQSCWFGLVGLGRRRRGRDSAPARPGRDFLVPCLHFSPVNEPALSRLRRDACHTRTTAWMPSAGIPSWSWVARSLPGSSGGARAENAGACQPPPTCRESFSSSLSRMRSCAMCPHQSDHGSRSAPTAIWFSESANWAPTCSGCIGKDIADDEDLGATCPALLFLATVLRDTGCRHCDPSFLKWTPWGYVPGKTVARGNTGGQL
jgi:hypothetical protein